MSRETQLTSVYPTLEYETKNENILIWSYPLQYQGKTTWLWYSDKFGLQRVLVFTHLLQVNFIYMYLKNIINV